MLETESTTAFQIENQPFDCTHLPAVETCIAAHNLCHEIAPQKGSDYDAYAAAKKAYRDAMPDPSSREKIRDFIACVTYGALIGNFTNKETSQFLYAAQVALNLFPRETARGRRPSEK